MTGLGIAIRIIHLGASLLLAGLFAFLLLVARPALQARKAEGPLALAPFDTTLLRLAGWSLLAWPVQPCWGYGCNWLSSAVVRCFRY